MDKNHEIELHERIARVETKVEKIDETLNVLATNHIPHLEANVTEIKTSLAYYAGGGIALITILNIVISILMKIWK